MHGPLNDKNSKFAHNCLNRFSKFYKSNKYGDDILQHCTPHKVKGTACICSSHDKM